MTSAENIDIGEVVQQSGLPASTLRYYEEAGLIQSTGRNGLRRQFNVNVLERLALITLAQQSGFALDEIVEMFPVKGRPEINREKLLAKADEIDKNIKRLTAMRNGLRHAADCPAPSHWECPTFLRHLRIAVKKRPKSRSKSSRH